MRTIVFPLLLVLCAITLHAQDIKTTFEQKPLGEQFLWKLSGTTDLPADTLLTVRLLFRNTVLQSARVRVRKGTFSYKYRPTITGVPKGTYTWEVSFEKQQQADTVARALDKVANFTHKRVFTLGSPREERQEAQEEAGLTLLRLTEAQNFLRDLRKESELFLQKKAVTSADKLQDWAQETRQKYQKLDNDIAAISKFEWGPYSPETFDDLYALGRALKSIYQARTEQVLKLYGLPLPKGQPALLADPGFRIPPYEELVERLARQIRSRLPLAENLQEDELAKELNGFNQIFTALGSEYRKQQDSFNAEQWQKKSTTWTEDLEDFQSRVALYRNSPLLVKFPTLAQDLDFVAQSGKALLLSYTAQLYKKAGQPIPPAANASLGSPQEIVQRLQERFQKLYEPITKKQELQREEESKARKLAVASFTTLQELNTKLTQEGLILKELPLFQEWQTKWDANLEDVIQKSKVWNPNFSELHTNFVDTARWLRVRSQVHNRMLKGEITPSKLEDSVMIRQTELSLQMRFRRLETEVANMAK